MVSNRSQIGSLNTALAAVLRGERGKSRLSVPDLETITGIDKTSLHRYLLDQRPLNIATLDKLAAAFKTTSWELMRQAEEERARVTAQSGIPAARSGDQPESLVTPPVDERRPDGRTRKELQKLLDEVDDNSGTDHHTSDPA